MIEIPLRARDGSVRAIALIDEVDARLAEYTWCLESRSGYAMRKVWVKGGDRKGGGVTVRLHRVVLGLQPGDGLLADHINGNRLDCRRANLRIATSRGNSQNTASKGGTSEYRGVGLHKQTGKWRARGMLDRREHHLGLFGTEREAVEAARRWRAAHMPYAVER